MSDQPAVIRILRFLMLISGGFDYSIPEAAALLEVSERTIYRYIETLKDAGFIINRLGDRVKIDKQSPYLKEISDLLHFTPEEAWILNKAILALDDETYIKENLARKLYAMYDLKGVPYPVVKRENSERVIALIRAIEEKRTVILYQYKSSNSSRVCDRIVEPFEFTLNYGFIWCYEPGSRQNKLFKTARIGKVISTGDQWNHEEDHRSKPTDIFRVTGDSPFLVKMRLSIRAGIC